MLYIHGRFLCRNVLEIDVEILLADSYMLQFKLLVKYVEFSHRNGAAHQ